jgi:MIP family channel proteins
VRKYGAELFGTFWLVLGGCGSAVLAAAFPEVGIGLLGVSLAFGLTVLTMAFAIGHISGCHLNPAVSVGLWAGGRFPAKELLPYIVAQVLGGVVAGGVLYVIASGQAGFDVSAGFASNGYGAHSPGGYSLLATLVTEVVMTMMFLVVILGATDKRAPEPGGIRRTNRSGAHGAPEVSLRGRNRSRRRSQSQSRLGEAQPGRSSRWSGGHRSSSSRGASFVAAQRLSSRTFSGPVPGRRIRVSMLRKSTSTSD